MDGKPVRLRLIAGIGIDVFALSAKVVDGEIEWSRKGEKVVFRNAGNTSIRLLDGKVCLPSSGRCVSFPERRLFPGNTWILNTANVEAVVTFLQRDASGFKKVTIPAK
jgi:hypothetical protein